MYDSLVDFNSNTTNVDYYVVISIVRLQLHVRRSFILFHLIDRKLNTPGYTTGPELVQYFS